MKLNDKKLIQELKSGAIAVIPTDTIYGLAGSAQNQKTVERIYKIKRRNPKKPYIILISSLEDLKLFRIKIDKNTKKLLKKFWPGKVSIIFPCENKKLSYLHRGKNSLAFRLPAKKYLLNLLKKTGPLVAPSANPEGLESAKTTVEARKYFGKNVDFYVSAGKLKSLPSKLIIIQKEKVLVLR